MIYLLLILSLTCFSQDSFIKEIDMELGQSLDYFSTANDKTRFSISGGSDFQFNTSKQLEFDFQYMYRLSNIHDGWLALQLKKVQATYDHIADTPVSTTGNLNSDSNFDRKGKIQNMTIFGVGYAQRFKFLREFINSDRVFETVAAYFNYVLLNDETTDKDYAGYGLTCDFGVHKRAGKKFFYGAKFSYNLASVIREPINDELKEDRSLAYSWSSFLLELGYFF